MKSLKTEKNWTPGKDLKFEFKLIITQNIGSSPPPVILNYTHKHTQSMSVMMSGWQTGLGDSSSEN